MNISGKRGRFKLESEIPQKRFAKPAGTRQCDDQIEIDTLINISFYEKINIRNMFIYKFLFRFLWIVFRKVLDIIPELFYN